MKEIGIVLLVFALAMLAVKLLFDYLMWKDRSEAVAKFERIIAASKAEHSWHIDALKRPEAEGPDCAPTGDKKP